MIAQYDLPIDIVLIYFRQNDFEWCELSVDISIKRKFHGFTLP